MKWVSGNQPAKLHFQSFIFLKIYYLLKHGLIKTKCIIIPLLNYIFLTTKPFKCQPNKIVKHTQIIRRLFSGELFKCDHFLRLALKRLVWVWSQCYPNRYCSRKTKPLWLLIQIVFWKFSVWIQVEGIFYWSSYFNDISLVFYANPSLEVLAVFLNMSKAFDSLASKSYL